MYKRILLFLLPLTLLLVFSVNSCQEDILLEACPSGEACIVQGDEFFLVEDEDYDFHNVGECSTGYIKCTPNGVECVEFVNSSTEICDGLDNDCNGIIDDDFDYDEDGYTTCGGDCDDNNPNVHEAADEICDGLDNDCDGLLGPTENDTDGDGYYECGGDCDDNNQAINPSAQEICNGIDDNCNEIVDDDAVLSNYCGPITWIGECSTGQEICVNSEAVCVGAVYPQNEVCNGLDDNCDGVVDNDLYRSCSTICGVGVETCYQGNWIGCTAVNPESERCDGVDNDCDGQTDEGCDCIEGDVSPCQDVPMYDYTTGEELEYPCGMGIKMCDSNGDWGDCYFFQTMPESCNNWDDDCDNFIDGMTETCDDGADYAGVGECELGQRECINGQWSLCIGQTFPEEEICDNLDNDCDGFIDEDLETYDKVDLVFAIDISGSMQPYIDDLAQALALYASDFENTEHKFALYTFPKGPHIVAGGEYSLRSGYPGNSLVDVRQFQSLISNLYVEYWGYEPSYDVSMSLMSPEDVAGVGWRTDAHPYVILITDEPAQTWNGIFQSDIGDYSRNCRVGDCEPGDHYEFYVMTKSYYSSAWIMALPHSDNFKILPNYNDTYEAYMDILRSIFKNACFDNQP